MTIQPLALFLFTVGLITFELAEVDVTNGDVDDAYEVSDNREHHEVWRAPPQRLLRALPVHQHEDDDENRDRGDDNDYLRPEVSLWHADTIGVCYGQKVL